jgi:protein-S-isoprenylcysteine O-methyltransferase Ste14
MTRREALPDNAGVRFRPPLLLAAGIASGFFLRGVVARLQFLPRGPDAILGAMTCAGSFALFLWAVYSMRKGGGSVPTGTPTEAVVDRGPYRYSRNPIYLSMLSLQLGIGVWANSAWFLLTAGLSLFLLSWGVVSREERYLERKFPDAYSDYRRRVRRWI